MSDTKPMEGARPVTINQFNINLPTPKSREEYMRMVTGQPPLIEATPEEGDDNA